MEYWTLSTIEKRKARKPHCCDGCGEGIEAGDRYEVTSGIFAGEWAVFKWCTICRRDEDGEYSRPAYPGQTIRAYKGDQWHGEPVGAASIDGEHWTDVAQAPEVIRSGQEGVVLGRWYGPHDLAMALWGFGALLGVEANPHQLGTCWARRMKDEKTGKPWLFLFEEYDGDGAFLVTYDRTKWTPDPGRSKKRQI